MPDDELPVDIQRLVNRMDPRTEVRAAIRDHLLAQRGLPSGRLRLSDGSIVDEGEAPE